MAWIYFNSSYLIFLVIKEQAYKPVRNISVHWVHLTLSYSDSVPCFNFIYPLSILIGVSYFKLKWGCKDLTANICLWYFFLNLNWYPRLKRYIKKIMRMVAFEAKLKDTFQINKWRVHIYFIISYLNEEKSKYLLFILGTLLNLWNSQN